MKPAFPVLAGLLLSSALLTSCTMTTRPVTLAGAGTLPFSDSVRVGQMVYLSGQIGTDASDTLVPGGIKAETLQALNNVEAALGQQGYTRADLVKCVVMLADMKDFAAMNEVYRGWMVKPYPVRSTFGTTGLALDARVEIECAAAR